MVHLLQYAYARDADVMLGIRSAVKNLWEPRIGRKLFSVHGVFCQPACCTLGFMVDIVCYVNVFFYLLKIE